MKPVIRATWAIIFSPLWVSAGGTDPIFDPGGPYEPCIGNCPAPTQFDGSGSSSPGGKIVLYEWDFGDGGTATGAMPEHQFQNLGDFTVTLTVTDDTHGVSLDFHLPHLCQCASSEPGRAGDLGPVEIPVSLRLRASRMANGITGTGS
jgi:hypothetical protein